MLITDLMHSGAIKHGMVEARLIAGAAGPQLLLTMLA
jgi:hypothetical protein